MTIQVDERENVREITDNFNPRIYSREFKCHACGEWVEEDDTVWIDPITCKATMEGAPYHVSCAPGELEDDSDM
jgi:hypothetical protein